MNYINIGKPAVLSKLDEANGALTYNNQPVGGGIPTVLTPDALPQNAQAGDLCLVLQGKQTVIPIDVDDAPNVNAATVVVNPAPPYQRELWAMAEALYSDVDYEEIDDENETCDPDETYYARSGEEGAYVYTVVDDLQEGDSVYGLYTFDAPQFLPPFSIEGGSHQTQGNIRLVPVVADKDDNLFTQNGIGGVYFMAERENPTYGYCLMMTFDRAETFDFDHDDAGIGVSYLSIYAWEPVTLHSVVQGEDLAPLPPLPLHAGWNHFAAYSNSETAQLVPLHTPQTMRFEMGTHDVVDGDDTCGLHFGSAIGGYGAAIAEVFGVLLDEQPNGLYRSDGTTWCPASDPFDAAWSVAELPEGDEEDEEEGDDTCA